MLLSVREIEKQFGGEQVFSDISFTLDEGHKVALVGKNGSGKSTLMKIIAGLEKVDSGMVKITNGRLLSYLPQEVTTEGDTTGIAYIQDGTNLQPHQFFPILEGLGVSQQVAAQKLSEMSGGQQTKYSSPDFY